MMCRRVFNDHKAHRVPVRHACGKCIPCRINAARDSVIRIITELKRHQSATFCTYTYSDDYVPKDGFLVKKHMQDMFKRLRKQLNFPIKVFYIGEYGDLFGRPHYHAIIFGIPYNSPVLRKPFIWPFGFSSFKPVIPARVRYISQYTVKKLKDDLNGNEKPTFSCRSQGFGDNLLQVDPAVCDRGYIQYDGQKYRVPSYYKKYGYLNSEIKLLKVPSGGSCEWLFSASDEYLAQNFQKHLDTVKIVDDTTVESYEASYEQLRKNLNTKRPVWNKENVNVD